MVEGKDEHVKALLAEYKQQVDALKAKIAEKQAEVEKINQKLSS